MLGCSVWREMGYEAKRHRTQSQDASHQYNLVDPALLRATSLLRSFSARSSRASSITTRGVDLSVSGDLEADVRRPI